MIADPYTLLMCALVNDGGSCIIVTSADRAKDCKSEPVWVLSGGIGCYYTSYYFPPTLQPLETRCPHARKRSTSAGVTHDDIDFVTTYDHFASGVLMEYEACGFCEVGEGGPFCRREHRTRPAVPGEPRRRQHRVQPLHQPVQPPHHRSRAAVPQRRARPLPQRAPRRAHLRPFDLPQGP